jgi:hypothetical protein
MDNAAAIERPHPHEVLAASPSSRPEDPKAHRGAVA